MGNSAAQTTFSRRAALWLAGIAGASMIGGLVLGITDVQPARSNGADTFSTSAVGHQAWVDLLRSVELPVVISRARTTRKAREGTVLVVAEPPFGGSGDLESMVREAGTRRIVIVLPKWVAGGEGQGAPWVDWVRPDQDQAERVLKQLSIAGDLGSSPLTPNVGSLVGTGALGEADSWQWVRSPAITPLLADGDRVLLGIVNRFGSEILLVSDPDLLNNAGLHRGDNAQILMAALGELVQDESVVFVFDETLHGFEITEGIFVKLFEFPLNLALIQAMLVLILLGWAASKRFGPLRRPAPALGRGRAVLIDNTAALLLHGGHDKHALKRYWTDAVNEVCAALHAPKRLDQAARLAWLSRVGLARGAAQDPIELASLTRAATEGRTDERRVLGVAYQIHAWRRDMLSGDS